MFKLRLKHYYKWLRASLSPQAQTNQTSTDHIRIQKSTKRPSSSLLYLVSPAQTCDRKSTKHRVSWFLQSPVSSPKATSKVETSHRLKQAKSIPEDRKIQDGDPRINKNILEYRGMGHINRPARRLPPYSNSPKIPKIPAICTQVSDLSVHLSSIRASPSSSSIHRDSKRGKTHGLITGHKDTPISGRLADQGSISGGVISQHKSGGRPNRISRLDDKSGQIGVDSNSSILFCGIRIPSKLSPCKAHSGEVAKTTGINPQDNQPVCPDCKTFDITHWVASINRKNGPRWPPSHETFSVASHGEVDIYSVVGQAPSLVRLHHSSSGLVAESTKFLKGADLHPQEHNVQVFTDASNVGWGTHLNQDSIKGLWSDLEKSLHINISELKAVFLALKHFRLQCQNQTVLVATDNSTVVAYINKQGQTHSVEMCALLWRIMSWCHRFKISLRARHIPGCLNVITDSLSRSTEIQSTVWSPHPWVFKRICTKWFTPQVDLFATRLNHKLPLYVSPVPDQNAWNIDALNISWSSLVAYAYPPTALLPKVIQKVRQYNCLLILIAPGWPGMPWFWDLVHLSVEIPLQLPASPNLLKQSSNQVFHNNSQYLNLHAWCLGVSNSKNKVSLLKWQRELLPLKGHQQDLFTKQSGPFLKNDAEKIRWMSPNLL